MWFNDKIVNCGEITTNDKFSIENRRFYIYLVPKTDTSNITEIINVKLAKSIEVISCPFQTNFWNPISIEEITLESSLLDNYRIFWGVDYKD